MGPGNQEATQMKTAAIMVGLWLLVAATGPVAGAADDGHAADHEALRALRAKVVNAINGRDVDALVTCFAPEFVFTAVDQTVLTDRAGVEAYLNRWFKDAASPLKSLTTIPTADILSRFTDPNSAYCYGSTKDVYTLKDGRKVTVPGRWTALVVRQDGAWKVAAAHVGVNFLDNPVMAFRTMPWYRKLGAAIGIGSLPGEE